MRCFFGWHKPVIRCVPETDVIFAEVRCDRCDKLLCRKMLAGQLTWVEAGPPARGEFVIHEMGKP